MKIIKCLFTRAVHDKISSKQLREIPCNIPGFYDHQVDVDAIALNLMMISAQILISLNENQALKPPKAPTHLKHNNDSWKLANISQLLAKLSQHYDFQL